MPKPVSGERLARRLSMVVSASVLFGAMMSIIKGNDLGLRDAIGNMSAPWLSLPFVAAVYAKLHRPVQGALVGLLATFCALTAFYFMNSFVLDLGPHPWPEKLGLTMRSGWFYFLLGFLSGPIWGFLGWWYIRHRTLGLAVSTAMLFVLEPCVWTVYQRFTHTTYVSGFSSFLYYPVVSVVEAAVGAVTSAALIIDHKKR